MNRPWDATRTHTNQPTNHHTSSPTPAVPQRRIIASSCPPGGRRRRRSARHTPRPRANATATRATTRTYVRPPTHTPQPLAATSGRQATTDHAHTRPAQRDPPDGARGRRPAAAKMETGRVVGEEAHRSSVCAIDHGEAKPHSHVSHPRAHRLRGSPPGCASAIRGGRRAPPRVRTTPPRPTAAPRPKRRARAPPNTHTVLRVPERGPPRAAHLRRAQPTHTHLHAGQSRPVLVPPPNSKGLPLVPKKRHARGCVSLLVCAASLPARALGALVGRSLRGPQTRSTRHQRPGAHPLPAASSSLRAARPSE